LLYFIGLGLEQSPTLKSLDILKGCSEIYYERYTSPTINSNSLSEISSHLSGTRIELVRREFVEDGRKILESAKKKSVALVCSGDPMVATTHQELRTRALKMGIDTSVIHGSSILSAVGGELGLHSYNFGRTVTMTNEPMQYTVYNTLFRNLLQGLHTILLLEWDESKNFFLKPKDAIVSLFDAERDLRNEVIREGTLVLIVSRIGSDKLERNALSLKEACEAEIGEPPHVLVIPGKLHFTEKEALGAIFERDPADFRDNSEVISKISKAMITKYSAKTLTALERAKKASEDSPTPSKFSEVFENVDCYTQDAKRFLNEGKDELAVLSIGYAEGLLDSLRFSKQLEFEW
jgi:diphthine synthase